jgi:hypothetical protein
MVFTKVLITCEQDGYEKMKIGMVLTMGCGITPPPKPPVKDIRKLVFSSLLEKLIYINYLFFDL